MRFENNNGVCTVKLLRTYTSKRPLAMQTTEPLYLTPLGGSKSPVWFKSTPVGVNSIGDIIKKMINSSPLAGTIAKKITNHSAWKTLVKKLKSNGIPKSDIITFTCHATDRVR